MEKLNFVDSKKLDQIINADGIDCSRLGYYPESRHTRLQDDTDGETTLKHELTVIMGPDGDMHIGVGGDFLRFRTWGGGGNSLRTHNALRILAEAIRQDNHEELKYES